MVTYQLKSLPLIRVFDGQLLVNTVADSYTVFGLRDWLCGIQTIIIAVTSSYVYIWHSTLKQTTKHG